MEQVKLLSLIVFGLLVAKTLPIMTKSRIDWSRNVAFSYLTPCLFFTSLVQADLSQLPSPKLLATYGLGLGGLFFAVRFWLSVKGNDTAAAATIKSISALYPNAVGIGVPLVFSLYGPEAELILMGIIVTNLVVVLPMVNILMIRSGEPGFYSYKKVVTDPILLAIATGLLINVWGITLYPAVVDGLALIGWAALPVILFILGASLSCYPFRSLMQEKVLLLLTVKIVVFPLTMLLFASLVFELSQIEVQVLVILASLPTGINVYLLSERYQVAKEATASVILFTTMLSLVSLVTWEKVLQVT
ncbi:AEC family transporter [Vibrio mediterranei]|uniref:AEC family transporter n=1 Tax=Vibrio TaxID=662 RepID=UPI0001542A39|nr:MULTISPECIES: AEC family transporter [Vibrio]EDL52279.1 Auxin Efflux Carrier [Vibrio mediterranei AK1]NUW72851.1 AEC family transporter [Vibrio mediterranei]USD99383.1 AEC family transporter [Vibrio sp. SCSIO 43133]